MKTLHLLITLLLLVFAIAVVGQSNEKPKYNLDLVTMVLTDTLDSNDVLAVFAVTPIRKKDFPPVLSMRVGYDVNQQGFDEFVNIQKQEENKVQLVIYGKSLPEKNPKLYELVENKIDLNEFEEIQLLVFQFTDISDVAIDQMSITYGLWEKRNMDKRIEQAFEREL